MRLIRSAPRQRLSLSLALGVVWAAAAAEARAQEGAARDQFVAWTARALHPILLGAAPVASSDLSPIRRLVGKATIVALSESAHASAELLELRNRVFQYLVTELGFTAIAIESGISESQAVHDYVLGGSGDLASVMRQGFSWTFDRFPQNEALVRWIHAYNADARHRQKVNFYGFDVPGSPGNPNANRGLRTALDETLRYLAAVDSTAAADARRKIERYLPLIRHDPAPSSGPQYSNLSQTERDQITATIADVVAMLERREATYTARSSGPAYQWGYRHAIGAREADAWLRRIPIGWSAPASTLPPTRDDWHFVSGDDRDRAMADNLAWIVDQEGPSGRILVFAARAHLSTVPLYRGTPPNDVQKVPLGTYLLRRYGDRLVSIGSLAGGGAIGCEKLQIKLPAPPPSSVAARLAQLPAPAFLVDLREAPSSVAMWLTSPNDLWNDFGPLTPRGGRGFDILSFTRTLSPACPP